MDWNLMGLMFLSIGVAGAVWVLWRRYDATQSELVRLSDELDQLHRVLRSHGGALRQLESQVRKAAVVPKSQSHQQRPAKTFRQAAKMLAMGVEPDEIRLCCELTKGEMDLLMQMQAAQTRSEMH
jgi:hypothetical protein